MAYIPTEWECGDVVTAEKLNNIEEGIQEALECCSGGGGGDSGYSCETILTTLVDEQVTTVVEDGYTGGNLSTSINDVGTVYVTFNGVEYTCDYEDNTYGASWAYDGSEWYMDFSTYPFGVESDYLYTENAGTYSLKIEKAEEVITTSECFEKIVRTLAGILDCNPQMNVIAEDIVAEYGDACTSDTGFSYDICNTLDSIFVIENEQTTECKGGNGNCYWESADGNINISFDEGYFCVDFNDSSEPHTFSLGVMDYFPVVSDCFKRAVELQMLSTITELKDTDSWYGNRLNSLEARPYLTVLHEGVYSNLYMNTASTRFGYNSVSLNSSTATGNDAVAEGNSAASGRYSHAEGANTSASGDGSHAEGESTSATQGNAHAEGHSTSATGISSHAEGRSTRASGLASHAEGTSTIASGLNSHASGTGTEASRLAQFTFGEFNTIDNQNGNSPDSRGDFVEIVGNGTSANTRSNARTLSWSGNETIAGTLTQSSDKRLKEHIDYLGDDAVEFIKGLKPAHYTKDDADHVGFYAQDVAEQDKWNCMTGEMNGYMTLGYTELIAPLVAYCQHLEKRIAELEGRNA